MIATVRNDQVGDALWGNADDVFGNLSGHWRIDRTMDGRALMQGAASFSATREGLAYHERGQITLASGVFDAERRYVFGPLPQGFSVWFAETPARLFHEIELVARDGALVGEAVHPCGDDIYTSRYVFRDDGAFTTAHIVRGPRKDYVLETMYRRAAMP